MELLIRRLVVTPSYALGSLYDVSEGQDEWLMYTKEPPPRADNVFISGETGLPSGRKYAVSLSANKRFGRTVPLLVSGQLVDAEGKRVAVGMRFLPGHHLADSEAGILVGQEQGPKDVHRTKAAYEQLYARLEQAIADGKAIELEITT